MREFLSKYEAPLHFVFWVCFMAYLFGASYAQGGLPLGDTIVMTIVLLAYAILITSNISKL